MYEADMYFAAIIRVAGQSQSDLGNEIAAKTAVWYHIGLTDTEQRVAVAREEKQAQANTTLPKVESVRITDIDSAMII